MVPWLVGRRPTIGLLPWLGQLGGGSWHQRAVYEGACGCAVQVWLWLHAGKVVDARSDYVVTTVRPMMVVPGSV